MKKYLLLLFLFAPAMMLRAQKVDSLCFHLYTDSLKKGQYNYINVDGKLSNGRWLPMGPKEIDLFCTEANFEGNDLVIPDNFPHRKVTVQAVLKANPAIRIERTIWIKQQPDPDLPTRQEILQGSPAGKKKNKSGR